MFLLIKKDYFLLKALLYILDEKYLKNCFLLFFRYHHLDDKNLNFYPNYYNTKDYANHSNDKDNPKHIRNYNTKDPNPSHNNMMDTTNDNLNIYLFPKEEDR